MHTSNFHNEQGPSPHVAILLIDHVSIALLPDHVAWLLATAHES